MQKIGPEASKHCCNYKIDMLLLILLPHTADILTSKPIGYMDTGVKGLTIQSLQARIFKYENTTSHKVEHLAPSNMFHLAKAPVVMDYLYSRAE